MIKALFKRPKIKKIAVPDTSLKKFLSIYSNKYVMNKEGTYFFMPFIFKLEGEKLEGYIYDIYEEDLSDKLKEWLIEDVENLLKKLKNN